MTALGWTLLAVLYFIGFTHGVVMLRANIIAAHRPFTWGMGQPHAVRLADLHAERDLEHGEGLTWLDSV